MKKIPIACQMYSLRDEWGIQPLESLRFLKEVGYTGVEFFGHYFSPEFHAALLKESGLACAGWHTRIDDLGALREDFDAVYLAIGAHQDNRLGLPGEDAEGVISAVELLRDMGDEKPRDVHGHVAAAAWPT